MQFFTSFRKLRKDGIQLFASSYKKQKKKRDSNFCMLKKSKKMNKLLTIILIAFSLNSFSQGFVFNKEEYQKRALSLAHLQPILNLSFLPKTFLGEHTSHYLESVY